VSRQIVSSDGYSIAYRLDGRSDAPILVLSNSLGATMDMWLPQMAVFEQHFKVLRYDVRGHGDSVGPEGDYTMDRLGGDVVELVEALGIGEFSFCGISMGGLVGQWLALRRPEKIKSLILANTAARIGSVEAWDERMSTVSASGVGAIEDMLITRFFSPQFVQQRPDDIENARMMIGRVSTGGYVGCCAAIRDTDFRGQIGMITARTLVLCGNHDVSTTVDEAKYIYNNIQGSQIYYLDAAHLSNIECPEYFSNSVVNFISESLH
jgi:3-oxoadipate enol-lactonase